jgi:hypothetical protein
VGKVLGVTGLVKADKELVQIKTSYDHTLPVLKHGGIQAGVKPDRRKSVVLL